MSTKDDLAHPETFAKIADMDIPVFHPDQQGGSCGSEHAMERIALLARAHSRATVAPISALHGFNVDPCLERIVEHLPVSPPYFPKDELTNKPMRFFISEIIREKILTHFKQEIPYSCEVVVESYRGREHCKDPS